MGDELKISIKFFGNLNFFLVSEKRETQFEHSLKKTASIKDIIESLGVPHPEIQLMLVNQEEVDFSYLVNDGDIIAVYPLNYNHNYEQKIKLRPPLPSFPSFILDVHLGKLTSLLRILGFNCLYRNDYEDEELAAISSTENRILLTRDLGLLKRSIVTYGYYVRSTKPEEQLREILQRYNLFERIQPFKRCLKCNGLLISVPKELIINQIPPQTRQYINQYYRCQHCQKIYWKGSHYQQIESFITRVLTTS